MVQRKLLSLKLHKKCKGIYKHIFIYIYIQSILTLSIYLYIHKTISLFKNLISINNI